MSDEDFLRFFAEATGADEGSVRLDTELASLEGWDSVAYLSTMTFLDEQMGVALKPDQMLEAVTVGDILTTARTLQS
jgi:acyl carrier protein